MNKTHTISRTRLEQDEERLFSDFCSWESFDKAKLEKEIAVFSEIAESYRNYLEAPRRNKFLAETVRYRLRDIYRLLRRLYDADGEPDKAFQAAATAYQLLQQDEETNPDDMPQFDEREEYIDYLIRRKRFELVPDVLRTITPRVFIFEGYERAERFYNDLIAVEELEETIADKLQEFRFLLGKTVPDELSQAEYLLYLIKNDLFQFFHDLFQSMTDEELDAMPKSGAASLPEIVREYDRRYSNPNDPDDDSPFYDRTDRILAESCPFEELEKCRALCEARNLKWRIRDFDRMLKSRQGLHDGVSG